MNSYPTELTWAIWERGNATYKPYLPQSGFKKGLKVNAMTTKGKSVSGFVLQVFLYAALGIRLEITRIKRVKGCAHNRTISAAEELMGKSTTSWPRTLSQSCKTWRNKVVTRRRQPEGWVGRALFFDRLPGNPPENVGETAYKEGERRQGAWENWHQLLRTVLVSWEPDKQV